MESSRYCYGAAAQGACCDRAYLIAKCRCNKKVSISHNIWDTPYCMTHILTTAGSEETFHPLTTGTKSTYNGHDFQY